MEFDEDERQAYITEEIEATGWESFWTTIRHFRCFARGSPDWVALEPAGVRRHQRFFLGEPPVRELLAAKSHRSSVLKKSVAWASSP